MFWKTRDANSGYFWIFWKICGYIQQISGKSTDIPRKNLCFFKQRQRKRSVDFPVDSEGLIRLGGALSCWKMMDFVNGHGMIIPHIYGRSVGNIWLFPTEWKIIHSCSKARTKTVLHHTSPHWHMAPMAFEHHFLGGYPTFLEGLRCQNSIIPSCLHRLQNVLWVRFEALEDGGFVALLLQISCRRSSGPTKKQFSTIWKGFKSTWDF